MAEVEALQVDGIDWVEPTTDGSHLILAVRAGGGPRMLAVPFDGLGALMALMSAAAGKAQAIRAPGQPHRHTFPVDRAAARTGGDDPTRTVLDLSIPGGMTLHFEMAADDLARLAGQRRPGRSIAQPLLALPSDTFEFVPTRDVA